MLPPGGDEVQSAYPLPDVPLTFTMKYSTTPADPESLSFANTENTTEPTCRV
jgi:hypothetical protein